MWKRGDVFGLLLRTAATLKPAGRQGTNDRGKGEKERAIISSRGAMSRCDSDDRMVRRRAVAGRETVFHNFFVPSRHDIGLTVYIGQD
jgi:hypothetical protein